MTRDITTAAALLVAAWSLWRTHRLERVDALLVKANSDTTDMLCDYMRQTQMLRIDVKKLEAGRK